MKEIIDQIKQARKKRFLIGEKALYSLISPNTEQALSELENEHGFVFPTQVKEALLEFGKAEIEDLYIHGPDMIYPMDEENGRLKGFVPFSSDVLGNYFLFDPKSQTPEMVFYYCHDPLGVAVAADSVEGLLQRFVDNSFDIIAVTENLELLEV